MDAISKMEGDLGFFVLCNFLKNQIREVKRIKEYGRSNGEKKL
jgi:hypothetical protein